MPTFNQVIKKPRIKQKKPSRFASLKNKPQIKGVVTKVLTMSPKKPNSAVRKVCNVILSNKKRTNAYIGGEGHTIQEHAEVLIQGARRKDLPGVRTRVVRGTRDATGVLKRSNKRSKNGTPRPN